MHEYLELIIHWMTSVLGQWKGCISTIRVSLFVFTASWVICGGVPSIWGLLVRLVNRAVGDLKTTWWCLMTLVVLISWTFLLKSICLPRFIVNFYNKTVHSEQQKNMKINIFFHWRGIIILTCKLEDETVGDNFTFFSPNINIAIVYFHSTIRGLVALYLLTEQIPTF